MSNRKIPRSPVERGIFCSPFLLSPSPFLPFGISLFVSANLGGLEMPLRSPSLEGRAGVGFSPSSLLSSLSCARHLRWRLSLRPFLRHCMPASFVCSFRRLVSVFFRLVSITLSIPPSCIRHVHRPLCRMSSGIFPLPLFLFCCLPAVLFLFLLFICDFLCLSAIFCIFLYFSAFLFAYIKK